MLLPLFEAKINSTYLFVDLFINFDFAPKRYGRQARCSRLDLHHVLVRTVGVAPDAGLANLFDHDDDTAPGCCVYARGTARSNIGRGCMTSD
jgi:hypothetical protein